jgi:hypothetical protein
MQCELQNGCRNWCISLNETGDEKKETMKSTVFCASGRATNYAGAHYI